MGGSALKNCETRRLNAADYFLIEKEVCEILRDGFIDSNGGYMRRAKPVIAYKTKADFGDLDVIFESDNLESNFCEKLKTLFNSKEIVPNGKVISAEYKNFQVDVILTPCREIEFATHYYAYNDLGNLMGRIAHKMGLKYGHDGLWFMFRDGTRLIAEINVSMDIKEVFKLLDFDYDRWVKGFENLEEIFEYVASSKYFNPDIYLFDQMNHRSRVRDAKRKTYNAFLDWCENKRNTDWKDKEFFTWSSDKSTYMPMLFYVFPEFKKKWNEAYRNMLVDREIKSKYNGEIVSTLTGLTDKKLGNFMAFIREGFENQEDFKTFLSVSSTAQIEALVLIKFNIF